MMANKWKIALQITLEEVVTYLDFIQNTNGEKTDSVVRVNDEVATLVHGSLKVKQTITVNISDISY